MRLKTVWIKTQWIYPAGSSKDSVSPGLWQYSLGSRLAGSPQILLMDEPASALDPQSTAKIEDLIDELCLDYTIVIVTHNMQGSRLAGSQQAARVSDLTAFLYEGSLIEVGPT